MSETIVLKNARWNREIYADTLAKKGAKITQIHIRETSYHSIKLRLKQVFQSAYRQELGQSCLKNHGSKN